MKNRIIATSILLGLLNVAHADVERVYTVTKTWGCGSSGCNIYIKGASGNIFDIYYTSGIGVNVGDRVIVLFDNDDNWKRISNASTGVSATITSVSR
jgi:hypothetical protein